MILQVAELFYSSDKLCIAGAFELILIITRKNVLKNLQQMIWELNKLLNFAMKVERKTGAKYSAH